MCFFCDMNPKQLIIEDFDYNLPDERIAKYPLAVRHESKLLLSDARGIHDYHFSDLPNLLQQDDLLVINNTRVIPARVHFYKPTGGVVEVFCLDPVGQAHQDAMSATSGVRWKCLVGGAKKWKDNQPLNLEVNVEGKPLQLSAKQNGKDLDAFIIEFTWEDESVIFSQLLDAAGKIPLPPYFNREAEHTDIERYQTVFAKHRGSVAAPTASLHFTPEVFDKLKYKGILMDELTLHVGAGTFKPVTTSQLEKHEMHSEWFSVNEHTIERLRRKDYNRLIAAGTTSMRTLESLYGIGVKLIEGKMENPSNLTLDQWESYERNSKITLNESLDALLQYLKSNGLHKLVATSALMIAPSFEFRLCDAIITNFHQPKSTLLVLVSAFIGNRRREVYEHALSHGYRFLSYGDSSLLWRNT